MSTSENASIRPCGCLCQLTGSSACCQHEDRRSETNVYRTYLDGFGDALVFGRGVKSIHYCPTCRSRLEPDYRQRTRRVKRSTMAPATSYKAPRPKPVPSYWLNAYRPSSTTLKKKKNYLPRLNTIDELSYMPEYPQHAGPATVHLSDAEDVYTKEHVASAPVEVHDFDLTRMEWPAISASRQSDQESCCTESFVAVDFDAVQSLNTEDMLTLHTSEAESQSWDMIPDDSNSIISWSTMSSQLVQNTSTVPAASYRDTLLLPKEDDTGEDNLAWGSPSKAERSRKNNVPKNRAETMSKRSTWIPPLASESSDDGEDFFSLREMAKSTHGGKSRYLFKGHPRGYDSGDCRRAWDKEGALLIKKSQKADRLRQCIKVTHNKTVE